MLLEKQDICIPKRKEKKKKSQDTDLKYFTKIKSQYRLKSVIQSYETRK